MVKIIQIDDIKTIINRLGIYPFFSLLIDELREDFKHWESFHKIPRTASHFAQGVIELMPIFNDQYYTFKYVNGHPNNPLHDKQTVVAFGALAEVESGYPLLISEMTLLTAFRTAATAALAADYLAKDNSTSIGIIGCGAQAEFLALAHKSIFDVQKIRYFDLDPKAMEKFAFNLREESCELIPCKSAHSTIEGVDIIITATAAKKNVRVLENEWLQPGVHINGVGGDCPGKTELDLNILERSKIVVEYLPQTLIEGEIQNLSSSKVYAELWEIIAGIKPGRVNTQEITLFDSVGFALEDFTILKLIKRFADEMQIGLKTALIPDLADPKNLIRVLEN